MKEKKVHCLWIYKADDTHKINSLYDYIKFIDCSLEVAKTKLVHVCQTFSLSYMIRQYYSVFVY